jgi:excisionase family DNA binding protein
MQMGRARLVGVEVGNGQPGAQPGACVTALQPLSVRIPDAVRLTGISRSRLYELLRSGEIEHLKVGRSTLIPYASLGSFIERMRRASGARG